jgi:hypothetical protein
MLPLKIQPELRGRPERCRQAMSDFGVHALRTLEQAQELQLGNGEPRNELRTRQREWQDELFEENLSWWAGIRLLGTMPLRRT